MQIIHSIDKRWMDVLIDSGVAKFMFEASNNVHTSSLPGLRKIEG